MISFTELHEQNHKIAELSKVLSHIIDDRSICDTDVTCDLFFEYTEKVKAHLDIEDRELYQALLTHKESRVKNTANRFLSGSAEIKRVFKQYLRRWCKNKQLRIRDHDLFVKETNEMFELVLKRIEDESEHLYPTAREVARENLAA
jgi:hemerythrin-like domain-containing protein